MKKVGCIFLIILFSVMFSQPALAEKSADPKDYPWKTGYVNLGGYAAFLDSAFRIGESNLGIGIDLDVEELGIPGVGPSDPIDIQTISFQKYMFSSLKRSFSGSKLPFQGKNS